MCIAYFENGVVPEAWKKVVSVPFYEGKEERKECMNYMGICMLSVVIKIYARVGNGGQSSQSV